jgi:hypothetical protein
LETDDELGVQLTGDRLLEVLFEIVTACRLRVLARTCACPQVGAGVPLARIWLRSAMMPEATTCTVECIDELPPFRRPLGPARWPMRPGYLNVGPMLWQRSSIACQQFADAGATIESDNPPGTLATSVRELADQLAADSPFVRCGAPIIVDHDWDPCERRRQADTGYEAEPRVSRVREGGR